MGIQAHTQLVLCPGINDGAALDQSIGDLAALWPNVLSVSAVPVGLTRHRKRWLDAALRSYDPHEAGPVLDQIEGWQKRLRAKTRHQFRLSLRRVLSAGRTARCPRRGSMTASSSTRTAWAWCARRWTRRARTARKLPAALPRPVRALAVTGTLAGEPMRRGASRPFRPVANLDLELCVVENAALGAQVTAAGLLLGADVVGAAA